MLSARTLSESEKAPKVCSAGSGAEKASKCSAADLKGALAIGLG